jgi:hypothetical protein
MTTATGVSVRASAATRPATAPKERRTASKSRATESTPASASGSSRLQALSPKSRAERPITQSASGGLSTVMKLPASSEPKKKAFQLWVAACTAAE